MAQAAEKLEANSPYSVDINMGCSAPEIRARGWGSALMADQILAAKIVRECRKKVKTLSVKCRAGFERSDYDNLFSFIKMLKYEGADFVSVHPRASDIAFKRSADWSLTERLVSENIIPIIGNGDIKTAKDAVVRLGFSPDGIMIGRAAVKMPWIFAEIEAAANSSEYTVNIEETALNVLSGIEELLPVEIRESRILKYCVYFCQNLKFGHALFTEIRRNPFASAELIRAYFERNPVERNIELNEKKTPDSTGVFFYTGTADLSFLFVSRKRISFAISFILERDFPSSPSHLSWRIAPLTRSLIPL